MDANDSPMLKPVLLSLPFDDKCLTCCSTCADLNYSRRDTNPPVSCLRKSLPSYVFIASSPNGSCSCWFLASTADRLNLIMGSISSIHSVFTKNKQYLLLWVIYKILRSTIFFFFFSWDDIQTNSLGGSGSIHSVILLYLL